MSKDADRDENKSSDPSEGEHVVAIDIRPLSSAEVFSIRWVLVTPIHVEIHDFRPLVARLDLKDGKHAPPYGSEVQGVVLLKKHHARAPDNVVENLSRIVPESRP